LLAKAKWDLLDPCWLGPLDQWLLHLENKAFFNTNPQIITIPDNVSFAIAGDWGTGNCRDNAPSSKVGNQTQKLNSDYTVHLGDVYYPGTKEEEINNLVDCWPMRFKSGFTLNSNHEMYKGAI
jgi:hypothetical protein|tara:strand:- start:86 stop:454 length:369 start_codon:yes stop_codon:yes gene_type:complete